MLRQRILTAVLLGPIVLLVILYAPTMIAIALFGLALLAGAWEWAAFAGFRSGPIRGAYVLATAMLMAIAWYLSEQAGYFRVVLIVAALWWCIAFVWLAVRPTQGSTVGVTLAGFLVIVPAWIALARLQQVSERGPQWVLFLLFLVWSADVGAYFAGRRFGRIKLAPLVSPGKTWEGVLGGLVAAGLMMVAGVLWFGVSAWPFAGLCCAVVLISIVGDLTESSFKRYAGLKDSGQLLPGHGGMLDRVDSVSAAAPIFVLGLNWLGVVR
jgi:phosphatidate cytidylyltransferase